MMRFQTTDQPVNIENTGRVTEKQRDGKTLEEGETNLFHWESAHSWMRTPGSWRKWQRWRVDSVIGSVNAQAQSWPHCSPSPLLPPEQTQDWHSLLLHTTSYARIIYFPNNYQNAYISLLNWEIFPVKFLATSPAESQLQQSCSIQSHCVLLTFSCVTVECLSLPTNMSEKKTYIAQTAYHCATTAVE